MNTTEWIVAIIAFLIAAGMAIISVRSFKNQGFLFNNAYIYASKKERETMDKKPHYRQSAIVFLILCFAFIVIGVSVVLRNSRIILLEIPLILGAIIYAVVSSVQISKKEKK
ncbi:MAG: DUF3784 domain-containing protein [Oscillospiraceae bacterium]|nr:DUF3784 domain-containing protein [Oscillospiraceae bacterium]